MYIRQDKLPKLKEYQYSGVDHSLVSRYVLKPFYTHVVIKCFPLWMAPNLITLTGFSFVFINFLTLLWYTPTLDQDCPQWVYISWAIGLFLYQTFDAVDGSQARRTRQGGPLGELFDHGVDAINTTLEVLLFSATMNLGQGWKTVLVQFAALMTFYVQTWDEYHTHTLTLGIISGPVEGILTLCMIFLATAWLGGGSFWTRPMFDSVGVPQFDFIPDQVYNLAWNEWYMVYGGIMVTFNTFSSARNVFIARRARGETRRVALLGLLTFAAAWILFPAYLYLQPVILYQHLVPFAFYAGIVNAYSVGRIIISHLTKSRFPRGNVLIYPLIYGVIDSLGPFLQAKVGFGWPSALGDDVYQVAFVFMCLGLAVGVHGSFVVDVIWTICDYLDIWCLTIKHPYHPEEEERKEHGSNWEVTMERDGVVIYEADDINLGNGGQTFKEGTYPMTLYFKEEGSDSEGDSKGDSDGDSEKESEEESATDYSEDSAGESEEEPEEESEEESESEDEGEAEGETAGVIYHLDFNTVLPHFQAWLAQSQAESRN